MLKRAYQKYIGSKFVTKLILVYSFIVLLSIAVTGNIITNNFISNIEIKEIEDQRQTLNKLKAFAESKHDKVKSIMLKLYPMGDKDTTISELFLLSNSEASSNMKKETVDKVRNFLYGISSTSDDILDLILIKDEDKSYFHSSSMQTRSVSLSYDFSRNKFLRDVEDSNASIKLFSDKNPEYIIGPDNPVITYAGNIYNPQKFPQKDIIGKYIINLPAEIFLRAYNEYSGTAKGTLLVTNSEGQVLFSTKNKYIGEKYQYFDKIMSSTGSEIMLEQLSIVNSVQLQSPGINIIIITPKDEITREVTDLKNQMILLILLCIAITLIPTLLVSNLFASRIKELAASMKEVQNGRFDIRINNKSSDEIGQLGKAFNEMCRKLNGYINRVYVAEIKTKNAELSALQSRINPHFLYNTLELIRMKAVSNNDEEVGDMVSILGRLFRWSVKGNGSIVRIEDELDYITTYLNLQKISTQGSLEVNINVPEQLQNLGIPKLLLQPLVENALYHGLLPKKKEGKIHITGRSESGKVIVDVDDDGVGMDDEQLKAVEEELDNKVDEKDEYYIGLSNVHQRIKLIFGREYGIKIASRKNFGTRVSVIIPSLTKAEMEKYVETINS